jgi:chemosensory pili system protein ChpA (sensor histidine kinase/response regulator)
MSDDGLVFGRFLDELASLIDAMAGRLAALDTASGSDTRGELLHDTLRYVSAIRDLAVAFETADIASLCDALTRAVESEMSDSATRPIPLLGARDAISYLRWRLVAMRREGAGAALDQVSLALVQSLEAAIVAGIAAREAPLMFGEPSPSAGGLSGLSPEEQALMRSFAMAELRSRDAELDARALNEAARAHVDVSLDVIPVEMKRLFVSETETDLQELSALIASFGHEPTDRSLLSAMARIIHKIKGTAATVGFPVYTDIAVCFERAVIAFQRGEGGSGDRIAVTLGRFLELCHICQAAAAALTSPDPIIVADAERLYDAATQPVGSSPLAPAPTPMAGAAIHLSAARSADYYEPSGRDTLLQVDSARLNALMIQLSGLAVNRGSLAATHANVTRAHVDMAVAIERLHEKSAHIVDAYPLAGQSLAPAHAAPREPLAPVADGLLSGQLHETWSDVELERSVELDTALRALTEVVADMEALSASTSGALMRMGQVIEAQEIVIANIQQDATRMRLARLAELTPRLEVLATHLAPTVGKRVRFSIEGEMTEIDRSLMGALSEPLNQLVRNALVHGIEPPHERRAVGKAEEGSVWIHAYYAGAEVVIEVGDDGRGVNSHALVARAISEGTLDVDRARTMSEDAALNLMFQLGVSTLDRSDALAGSGIGLDEVATLIRGIRGDISVASSSSQGTIFRIRVPMTLTVLPTLELSAANHLFTAPFSSVVASLTDVAGRLHQLPVPDTRDGQAAAKNKPSEWRLTLPAGAVSLALAGETPGGSAPTDIDLDIPAFSLAECLGLAPSAPGPEGAAVVIERYGQYVAFLVDSIGAMRETMVRPLPSHLKRQVIRGVTIRSEDGAMALLIDTGELVEQRLVGAATPPHRAPAHRPPPQPVARVLIVDDSITIRRTLDQMLTGAGFSTALACDGYEALEMMEVELPRVVILDVEMPRLSGYELLSVMRSTQKYRQTRVVMLTSRAGAKHEQYARELGADDYLVKPCPQDTLISVVRRLLMESERS